MFGTVQSACGEGEAACGAALAPAYRNAAVAPTAKKLNVKNDGAMMTSTFRRRLFRLHRSITAALR
jgi:hypothetical protein